MYASTHATIEAPGKFRINDLEYIDIVALTEKKGFEFRSASVKELDSVNKAGM